MNMGGTKDYLSSGGFTDTKYKEVGKVEGIKILEKVGGGSSGLPLHSKTVNTTYAIRDSNTGKLKQIAFYKDRTKYKEIDWGHEHEGMKVHVHTYTNGERKKIYRKASKKEKRIYETVKQGGEKNE